MLSNVSNNNGSIVLNIFFVIPVLLIIEWLQRTKEHPLKIDNIKFFALRCGIYYALIFAIILFGAIEANQFMYFQI
jgi:hypothetical protein